MQKKVQYAENGWQQYKTPYFFNKAMLLLQIKKEHFWIYLVNSQLFLLVW